MTDKLKRAMENIFAHNLLSMGSRKLRQLCYNSQSLVGDLNSRPHEYAAKVLTTQL